MSNIIERLGLANEVKEITLGRSFSNGGSTYFHTFRYDFKPASVDAKKAATVDIGERHQVTVSVPHVDKGSGTTHAVFKGSKKPYTKECVLIIDHVTGEITLEKLTYNVQLKKTRAEGTSKIKQNVLDNNVNCSTNNNSKKMSPVQKNSPKEKSSNSKASTWGSNHFSLAAKCSPLPKSPNSQSSPPNRTSPPVPSPVPLSSNMDSKHSSPVPFEMPSKDVGRPRDVEMVAPEIGVLTSSESSSSDDSSASDSDSSENEAMEENVLNLPSTSNPNHNGTFAKPAKPSNSPTVLPSMPKFSQLTEDLQLSESDSDDD